MKNSKAVRGPGMKSEMACLLPAGKGNIDAFMDVPTSKSLSNRALLLAAAAGGGEISGILDCRDTRVLARALWLEGWDVSWEDGRVRIGDRTKPSGMCRVDMEDSGTGARLLAGLLATMDGDHLIEGSRRLAQRPMKELIDALIELGAEIEAPSGTLPLRIRGSRIEGGKLFFEPRVSSQFVSSILMAAPRFRKGLELEILGHLPSAPYLKLSRDVMEVFGAEISCTQDLRSWSVAPGGLQEARYEVEGDWSAAAFPLAALAVCGGQIQLGPLNRNSHQGDAAILNFLQDAGVDFHWEGSMLHAGGIAGDPIMPDLLKCPDLFPAMVVIAACRLPGSVFSGIEHLKHKESDRLRAMTENLESLGAEFELFEGKLTVSRTVDVESSRQREVLAHADHRIAMAMAVTALYAGPLLLDDPSCVGKSFPGFWEAWEAMLQPDSSS